ncbi:MAG: tetratricopeptide repeat protein [Bacillota bacterium]|nr:tetratricopeptide repeat protein [Bacillota bacterium]
MNYKKLDLAELRKLAEARDPKARLELADRYRWGKGVERSEEEEHKWVRLAALQGYAEAQYLWGSHYQYSWEKKQRRLAIKWYKKAAEQGYAGAEIALGDCYCSGELVRKDEVKAFNWYKKAAERGDSWAQNSLGFCYENGIGVEADRYTASYWYKQSADQGFPYGIENYERLFHSVI